MLKSIWAIPLVLILGGCGSSTCNRPHLPAPLPTDQTAAPPTPPPPTTSSLKVEVDRDHKATVVLTFTCEAYSAAEALKLTAQSLMDGSLKPKPVQPPKPEKEPDDQKATNDQTNQSPH